MKDYDYSTWMRIFPKYRELEEEYDKMGVLLDEQTKQISRLKKRLNIALKEIKKLKGDDKDA